MSLFFVILFFIFLGSVVSLIGAFLLVFNKELLKKYSHYFSSFAAGTLLGAAFFDLLPEAISHADEIGVSSNSVFIWVLGGVLFFFLIERLIHWFHHHNYDTHDFKGKPVIPLIVVGDTLHNFIDGIAIASTFMVSIPVGIATAFAVGAHEIPQEIGDFGVLVKNGLSKFNALKVNILSALISFLGAGVAFYFGQNVEILLPFFISISAGFFLYIALSDLIPEIHHENKKELAVFEILSLLLGVFSIYILLSILGNVLGLAH